MKSAEELVIKFSKAAQPCMHKTGLRPSVSSAKKQDWF
jgi:hypothetical protein